MSGPSENPDPAIHAYRHDLADVVLAGRVIASHYAEPLTRHVAADATLFSGPDEGSDALARLAVGAALRILDSRSGWAWGYGPDGRVGYVRSDALVP